MKKQVLLTILVLLVLNVVSATITIESAPLEKYKIGETISTSITIENDYEDQAFVSATIDCPDHNLNFFRIPYTTNFINIPEIEIDKNFVGECKLVFKLLNSKDTAIESLNSEPIEITNQIALDFTIDKETYNPGEKILLNGELESNAELTILLIESGGTLNTIKEQVTNQKFSITIDLSDSISAGKKTILLSARDEVGNQAEDSTDILINQIAKSISLDISEPDLGPTDTLTFKASVTDQSGNPMPAPITYRVYDPNENIVESINSEAPESLDLAGFYPGEYIIKSSYKNLESTNKFSIREVKEIDLTVEEGIVTIVNIGNVRYVDDFSFEAKVDETAYQVPISLDLSINEKIFVDLKSELPTGSYEISALTEQGAIDPVTVEIVSNRPVVKRLSQGLSQVTGSAIIETDKVGNVFYLGFFIVFIGFILVFAVNRRFKSKITQVVDDTIVVQGKQNKGLKDSLSKNQKEKSVIKDMFGSYVDHNILKKNFKSEIMKKEISILFTDIRGFSKIFDNYDSEEIAEMLNVYFGNASKTIKKNNGFINKFIGDSVMALFNAASKDENHLLNTVRSAIEMKNEMIDINKKLKEKNLNPIDVGYGIDSGPCAVGTIGSKEKLEFTAIGAPVNIAFRLQSISDGSILITERVYKKIKTKIKAKLFGEYEMKNITGKVKAYKVLGIK